MSVVQEWTVFAVYDDNDEPYTEYIKAKTWQEARKKALQKADGVILIAGIVPGRVQPVDVIDNVAPIRGIEHAIEVNMVTVQRRALTVPGRCQKCKADLRRAHAIAEDSLVVRQNTVHLSQNQKDLAPERDGLQSDKKIIETVGLTCTKCKHVIWGGVSYV